MIKLEHIILPSDEQIKFVIEGARNPLDSWKLSDFDEEKYNDNFNIGANNEKLFNRLSFAGTDHRKYLRMIPVCIRITAPLYWWKEFDTYKVGTVANSCSTMHKIQAYEFTRDMFSVEHLNEDSLEVIDFTIEKLNKYRKLYIESNPHDKQYWWQMIQLLPSTYNQTRNVTLNYEVLANIYKSRKNHKLDEWVEFCNWIESLPLSNTITHNISLDEFLSSF